MGDILLRDALEQLRAKVTAGEYADAVALAQHILRYYPKHVETYLLLAQVSLETNDHAAAADLFQRVRSADPENIIALLGLGILAETAQRLDDAVWYLELAFEMQPWNGELRRELARVYEQREGAPS